MVYKYSELLNHRDFGNDKKIKQSIENKILFKLECGLYSDKEKTSDLEIIAKLYERAIFTSDSAYFYHGLADNIPSHYYLATKKRTRKIIDKRIIQTFGVDEYFLIGDGYIYYNNVKLRIYDKERMLIELVRNKNKISYDMYKEIISNYRNIVNELNFLKLQRYLEKFSNGSNLLKTIQEEVL